MDAVFDRNLLAIAGASFAIAQVIEQDHSSGIGAGCCFRNSQLNGWKFGHAVLAASDCAACDAAACTIEIVLEGAMGGAYCNGGKTRRDRCEHRNRVAGV